MKTSYEKLPLTDLSAPKVLGRSHRRGNNISSEIILQNSKDAARVLKLAGLNVNLCAKNIIEASEKYMVETQPNNTVAHSSAKNSTIGMVKKRSGKPHYTHLIAINDRLVFQAACCLPLKVIAANLDSETVNGRTLFSSHSENDGAKLIYEFLRKGTELIIDLKRGKSTKTQRLIFRGNVIVGTASGQ